MWLQMWLPFHNLSNDHYNEHAGKAELPNSSLNLLNVYIRKQLHPLSKTDRVG